MISEVLGLLLGQIAVLSMQRFFKAMPKLWIQKYLHPFVRQFLRCDESLDTVSQSTSINVPISSSTCQQFLRFHMKMQIIIDLINQAFLKLHNYDKQLIRFEETFIGSTIILIIIFGILLTVLLWLRRLSYAIPHGFSQNFIEKRYEWEDSSSKGMKTQNKVLAPELSFFAVKFTSNLDNLGEKSKKVTEKSQNNLSLNIASVTSEINLFNNSINPTTIANTNKFEIAFNQNEQINRTKEIVIGNESNTGGNTEMLFTVHRQRYEQTCKSNLSDSFNSCSSHQMKQRIYEVKRQVNDNNFNYFSSFTHFFFL
ncbi:unnamed protein product [Brugia pahangi]|uniref:Chloride channel CLIC-like protein 1 n=1 Tax=Brugia pahangi TaxID=6280 RepID=A0A0N4TJY1_BRUPA|nr:unnamed protein product [Brugia pahangi]